MYTWKMIKILTEADPSSNLFFGIIDDNEGITICYLNPNSRSIEFRYYDFINKKLEMNPIIYTQSKWENITEEEAKRYLGKNLYSYDIVE